MLTLSKASFKFYFILLGIGIGFIFSGIYFTLNPQIEYRDEELTDDEILDRAKVIMLESVKDTNNEIVDRNTNNKDNDKINENNNLDVKDNLDDINDDTEQESHNILEEENNQTDDNKEKLGGEDSLQKDRENLNNNDVTDENLENEKDVEYVTVEIKEGDRSDIIVQKLFDAGVIDDAEDFHKFIEDNNAEKKLVYGLLELKKGEDYESLLHKLIVD